MHYLRVRRKSILKGSTSIVDLDASHTSPLAVHDITESSEELRSHTLANTLNNKRLPPVLAQLIPDVQSTATTDTVLCSTEAATSTVTSGQYKESPVSTGTVTLPVSDLDTSTTLSSANTVENKYRPSVGFAIPPSKNSVSFQDDDLENDSVSPILQTRPTNPRMLLPNTPIAMRPPPIIVETSPPDLPAMETIQTRDLTFSALNDDQLFPVPGDLNTAEKRFSSSAVSSSNKKSSSSMQRQSATRNLISSASSEGGSEQFQSLQVNPHNNLSSSLTKKNISSLVSMHPDVPIPAINRPGSRSAIYSTENFSLTPEVGKDKTSRLSYIVSHNNNLNTTFDATSQQTHSVEPGDTTATSNEEEDDFQDATDGDEPVNPSSHNLDATYLTSIAKSTGNKERDTNTNSTRKCSSRQLDFFNLPPDVPRFVGNLQNATFCVDPPDVQSSDVRLNCNSPTTKTDTKVSIEIIFHIHCMVVNMD